MIPPFGELRDYVADYLADDAAWQETLDTLRIREHGITAMVDGAEALIAQPVSEPQDVAAVDVVVSSREYGEGATFTLSAYLTDFGPAWQGGEEEPEGRWRLTTAGRIERTGRGGACLGANPDGDPMVEWLDEQDVARIQRSGLGAWVRGEFAEYGRDRFAGDDEEM